METQVESSLPVFPDPRKGPVARLTDDKPTEQPGNKLKSNYPLGHSESGRFSTTEQIFKNNGPEVNNTQVQFDKSKKSRFML